MTSRKSKYGLYMRGFDRATIDDIRINGCTFTGVTNGNIIEHATNVHFKDTSINGAIVANPR